VGGEADVADAARLLLFENIFHGAALGEGGLDVPLDVFEAMELVELEVVGAQPPE